MRKALRLRTSLSIAALALVAGVEAQQNVGINVTGAAPNASALLDLDVSGLPAAGKRGLLIPRVTRANRLAIVTPPTGLWVYQTDDVTAPVFDVTQEHGYWYFDGAVWVRWSPGMGSWTTTGNAGTNPTTFYFGTRGGTTNLNMRTINPQTVDPQMVVMGTTGHVGINTVGAPPERLDVNGAMHIFPTGAGAGSATNLAGTIRYDNVAQPNRWHFANHNGLATGWQRLENAEEMVTSAAGYTRDSLGCGVLGEMTTSPLPANVLTPGTDNGTTPVVGNVNTPFPTNIGVNNRIARTQYLYRATELAEMGLCAGNITEVAFYVLGADVNLPSVNTTITFTTTNGSANVTTGNTTGLYAGVNVSGANIPGGATIASITNGTSFVLSAPAIGNGAGALTFTAAAQQANINCELRIGAATQAGLTGAGATFTGSQWDNAVQALPAASTINTVVLGGWQFFTLGAPFNWNGTSNIIVDVYWLRGSVNGNSPPVQLVTGLPYNATRQGLPNGAVGVGLPNVAAQVPSFDDLPVNQPSPPGLTMTNATTRPVTRFKGQVKTPFNANVPNASLIRYSGGVMLGDAAWASAAGNYKGPGTIHAKVAVYDGNSVLNDHVFDRYFDGTVRPEDRAAAAGYQPVPLAELKDYLKEERHLPNMPSRSDWSNGGMPSLGELQNGLWQQVETQALYITELERDLTALEALAFGDADEARSKEVEADIHRSPRLTEQQKLHLITALRDRAASK